MRYGKNLKRLLKIAQTGSLEAWQEVKAEAESEELPPGFDTEKLEGTAAAAKTLTDSAAKAKSVFDSLSAEERQAAKSIISSEQFLNAARTGAKYASASNMIDVMLIKAASRFIDESEAISIIRDINLYRSQNNIPKKIASKNIFESIYLEKISAFDAIISDEKLLAGSSISKISKSYSSQIRKEAGIGSSITGFLGKAWGFTKVLAGTLLPIGFLIWSAYDLYNAYTEDQRALEEIKKSYSDLGDENSLLDPSYILNLINENKNDPEAMLRIVRLNKISKFYKKNWYAMIWSAAMATLSIIELFLAGVTGGVSALVIGGLKAILKGAALFGPVSTGMFDVGTQEYNQNLVRIATISDQKIEELGGQLSEPEAGNSNDYDSSESSNFSAEEQDAISQFRQLQSKLGT